MAAGSRPNLARVIRDVEDRHPGQVEFHQAVREVFRDVLPLVTANVVYRDEEIVKRIVEPDRVVSFRVVWQDDAGARHVDQGWRIQHSNALGPYKGGLRFRGGLTEGVLRFLAFEQTFKNSLTGLPIGGAKGGATFEPRGRSSDEIMRFCQAFMTELHRYIGPDRDIPAGDIGVGAREIDYLFGHYRRLAGRSDGGLTGKGMLLGGSALRAEATGYGVILFTDAMLHQAGEALDGRSLAISGSGNVALHAAAKAIALGGRVLTLSDSDGFIHDPDGIDAEKLAWIIDLKRNRRGRIADYAAEARRAVYHRGRSPWGTPCDIALPCATQNELDADDVATLAGNGAMAIVEGSNMPCTAAALCDIRKRRLLFGPGKAANAGGVAVSAMELAQNATGIPWPTPDLPRRLGDVMSAIHDRCVDDGRGPGRRIDYLRGANIAAFRKVADAIVATGVG
ncbi:MAG: NADP-specific glutamate dehydrogenase [Brevundimonas sp.]|nr:MAG: NADP-specific glutamate dehydrogenase [Brevundimonas sp.]